MVRGKSSTYVVDKVHLAIEGGIRMERSQDIFCLTSALKAVHGVRLVAELFHLWVYLVLHASQRPLSITHLVRQHLLYRVYVPVFCGADNVKVNVGKGESHTRSDADRKSVV